MQIERLKIYSSNIEKQTAFYSKIFEMQAAEEIENRVSFKVGRSVLQLEQRKHTTPCHFAINIPANKIAEALNWIKARTPVLRDVNKEIHDFKGWNAEAVYFYDMDKNIVELIARKNLNNPSEKPFSSKSFLEISEIGIATDDIEKIYVGLNQYIQLEVYDGNFKRFCATGDEQGLFILINKDVKKWFPVNDNAFVTDFGVIISNNGKVFKLKYAKGEINWLHPKVEF